MPEDTDLASLDDDFEYTLIVRITDDVPPRRIRAEATWGQIFASIAPDLLLHPNDSFMDSKLGATLFRAIKGPEFLSAKLDHDNFQTIKVQLSALGLIDLSYKPTVAGPPGLFWILTKKGERLMMQLRTVRRTPKDLITIETEKG